MKRIATITMLALLALLTVTWATEEFRSITIPEGHTVWGDIYAMTGGHSITSGEEADIKLASGIKDFRKVQPNQEVLVPIYLFGSYPLYDDVEGLPWKMIGIIGGVILLLGLALVLFRKYRHSMTHKYGRGWKSRRPHPLEVMKREINYFAGSPVPAKDEKKTGRRMVSWRRRQRRPLVLSPWRAGNSLGS